MVQQYNRNDLTAFVNDNVPKLVPDQIHAYETIVDSVKRGPIPWPARSPDLTPMDFYLWGHMKSLVYNEPHPISTKTVVTKSLQLLTEAELRVTRSSQPESGIVNELLGDEEQVHSIPSTSSVPQPPQPISSSSVTNHRQKENVLK
uniref:SFRICE_034143 n=1 Tax=Spodoptera frugiperda TaxID=7108 RepID=A0A2H1V4P8_SPOFR